MGHQRYGRRNGYYNGNGGSVFNAGTAINVFTIPIITACLSLAGFYYVTKDELQRHDLAISTTIPAEIKAEQEAREKTRNEFLAKFDKLNDGVSSLNAKAAVADDRNATISDTLKQIRDQLATVPLRR